MRSILPKLFLASAVVATAALATPLASAATLVNVPFSFTANGKTCPPGLYTVAHEPSTNIVSLATEDGRRNFSWVMAPGDPAPTDTRVILSFDTDGQNHALRSVQFGHLITSRLDRKRDLEEQPVRIGIGQ
jgi:hypothetical protein